MTLTHLDKIYWPKEKLTKGDLIAYYEKVAQAMLPYLKDRPVILHRFPDGIDGVHFIQKSAGAGAPPFVKTAEIQHEGKKVKYVLAQNEKTLLYLANLGSIELHTFNARIKTLSKPDYLILDLDRKKAPFSHLIEVALFLHEKLDKKKIPHFCKTSGGAGLHIYVPLQAKYSHEEAQAAALRLAQEAQEAFARLVSLERMPSQRINQIYIDFLQNRKLHMMICPYSARGKPGATVSTPLEWKEVKAGLDPRAFTIETVPARLAEKGDLFKEVLR